MLTVKRRKHPSQKGQKCGFDTIESMEKWNDLSQRYKDFVEENKGKELTVEYDERFKDRPLIVCLKEDPSEVKWLFSVLDLEVVK